MTATAPVSAPDWTDVLTDFVGLRLAIYDELLRSGSLGVNQLAGRIDTRAARVEGAVENALRWLAAHHLARREESGRWAHRGVQVAARLYAERGPDTTYHFTPGGSLAAQERSGDRRESGVVGLGARVEAAGGVSLSHSAPPPPRPTVHFSGLLDLGEY